MTKKEVRKKIFRDRKNINFDLISNRYIEKILESKILDEYNNIGIYYPLKYEINLMKLIEIYKNKNFYLPKTEKILKYIKYDLNDPLYDGIFNTKEPLGEIIDVTLLDCIFIPCVAISRDKKRVGYGKGYYDKTLAEYRGLKIGICHKEFINIDVEMEEFDLIMDLVIV